MHPFCFRKQRYTFRYETDHSLMQGALLHNERDEAKILRLDSEPSRWSYVN